MNIFEKDFIVIPINKNAHWYIAIICYPNLREPVYEPKSNEIKNEQIIYEDVFDSFLLSNANESNQTNNVKENEINDDCDSFDEAEENQKLTQIDLYKQINRDGMDCVKLLA